jgi:hypothetical protein
MTYNSRNPPCLATPRPPPVRTHPLLRLSGCRKHSLPPNRRDLPSVGIRCVSPRPPSPFLLISHLSDCPGLPFLSEEKTRTPTLESSPGHI